jgi:hypothetical protein
MRAIPPATKIALAAEERQALEALAGSRKREARMQERARVVLPTAAGAGGDTRGGPFGDRIIVGEVLALRSGRQKRSGGSLRDVRARCFGATAGRRNYTNTICC